MTKHAGPPDVAHVADLHDEDSVPPSQSVMKEIKEQSCVCCTYDGFPWIGMVDEVSEEFGDYHINFMHPHGPTTQFKWPSQVDQCWVTGDDILCTIDTPSLTSSSSRKYVISENDVARIASVYPDWIIDE